MLFVLVMFFETSSPLTTIRKVLFHFPILSFWITAAVVNSSYMNNPLLFEEFIDNHIKEVFYLGFSVAGTFTYVKISRILTNLLESLFNRSQELDTKPRSFFFIPFISLNKFFVSLLIESKVKHYYFFPALMLSIAAFFVSSQEYVLAEAFLNCLLRRFNSLIKLASQLFSPVVISSSTMV